MRIAQVVCPLPTIHQRPGSSQERRSYPWLTPARFARLTKTARHSRNTRCRLDGECQTPYHWRSWMQSALRKLVAVFVLVWALGDLGVPGLCQTDFPDFGAAQSTLVSAQRNVSHQQQSESFGEDDCFCCCSHIAPATPVALSEGAIAVADWPEYVIEKPREFSSSLYHPPRS